MNEKKRNRKERKEIVKGKKRNRKKEGRKRKREGGREDGNFQMFQNDSVVECYLEERSSAGHVKYVGVGSFIDKEE